MASTIFNAPYKVPALKGFDRNNYVGLRPTSTLNFSYAPSTAKLPHRGAFVVRASQTGDGPAKKLGMTDAECEAAVVAGNIPEAPPVPPKPAAPAGTPVIQPIVSVSIQTCCLSDQNWYLPDKRKTRKKWGV